MATISYLPCGLEAHVARATESIQKERRRKRIAVVVSLIGGAAALAVAVYASFSVVPARGASTCNNAGVCAR